MKSLLFGLVALMSFSSIASTKCLNDVYNKILWTDKTIAKKMFELNDASEQAIKEGNVHLAEKLSAKMNKVSRSALQIAEIACEK